MVSFGQVSRIRCRESLGSIVDYFILPEEVREMLSMILRQGL